MTASPPHDMDRWSQRYEEERRLNDAVGVEIEFALKKALGDKGIKIHSCISRVKTLSSFQEKIVRKGYKDPFTEMRDIVGGRVVCLFQDDVAKVDEVIRENFSVQSYEDKSKTDSPDTWRYASVHYDCTLGPKFTGQRYDWIQDRVFELQVRTILQDAWATVEHYLAYKGANSVPDELRRDFSALAGLFHVADRSFQQLFSASVTTDQAARERLQSIAEEGSTQHKYDAENEVAIDRSTIKALLRQMFPDRDAVDDTTYSELVEELAAFEIRFIGELRSLVEGGLETAEHSEIERPPTSGRYFDAGIARIALDETVSGFKDWRIDRYRKQHADALSNRSAEVED